MAKKIGANIEHAFLFFIMCISPWRLFELRSLFFGIQIEREGEREPCRRHAHWLPDLNIHYYDSLLLLFTPTQKKIATNNKPIPNQMDRQTANGRDFMQRRRKNRANQTNKQKIAVFISVLLIRQK